MKFALLAAAALMAAPALAQTTGSPTTGTPVPNGMATDPSVPQSTAPGTPPAAPTGAPGQDAGSAPAGGDQSAMPQQGDTTASPSTMTTGGSMPRNGGTAPAQPAPGTPDPAGGYAPGSNTMGSMSASQAFPAPAPLKSYPTCKPGQYDDCMQASGSGSHRRATRRRR